MSTKKSGIPRLFQFPGMVEQRQLTLFDEHNFGHASVDTTSIYITAELDRRIELMESFALKTLPG